MRYPIFAIALFLWPQPFAQASDCGKRPVMTTTRQDGTKVGVLISDAQFAKAPSWSIGDGEPPLPISKAVEIGRKWAAVEYKRYDSVRIQSISLSQSSCMSDSRKWYYMLHFVPVMDGNPVYGGGNFAAVLLDGTIVGPTQLKDGF
jgi:hypothetical protein